jgi:hypothetical protein
VASSSYFGHSPDKGGFDMAQKNATPNKNQKVLIRRRGLNPDNYTVLKELNYSLFLIDKRDKSIKIIEKRS